MSFILSVVFGVIGYLDVFVDGHLGLSRGGEVRVSRDDRGERGVQENRVKS